jgi:hypothetical protein
MESGGARRESHVFSTAKKEPWELKTGRDVQTRFVEFEPIITR